MEDKSKIQFTADHYSASSHFTHAGFKPNNDHIPVTDRAKYILNKENQLFRELLSVNSLDPFVQHSTSPRKQMSATQITQSLVVKGSTARNIQTGMEREYAKYTFNIKAPTNLRILRIIERYPQTHDIDSIAMNPQTIAIYEDVQTKEVGYIDLVNYCSNHQYFGFKYRAGPALKKLHQNAFISKDEVFMESPSVAENGDYKYGIEANIAHLSLPGVSEDGFIVSRSMAERMSYKTYETRVVEFSDRVFPVMIYSDGSNNKICPDIGEKVREDGLLMALRNYNVDTAVYDHSPHGMREFQTGFDKPIYVPPNGRVVDIQVIHNPNNHQRRVLHGLDDQLHKYQNAMMRFYKEIVSEYKKLRRLRKDSLVLTPQFNQLVVRALLFTDESDNRNQLSYRNARIEDWRLEFTIEYDNVPGVGFKLSDVHGGKGVIVKVEEDENMPVDAYGNRADVVGDPLSTIARSILGRAYEPKYNAIFRELAIQIKRSLGLNTSTVSVEVLKALDQKQVFAQFEELLKFYKIISPEYMFVWFSQKANDAQKYEHLASVLSGRRVIFLPPENEPESPKIVKQLNETFGFKIGPVSYVGNSGKRVTTKEDVLIGSAYIIALDKTGTDYAAVNSGRLQHHGVLAQLNNMNKYSAQIRQQPPRFWGEGEIRILAATCPPEIVAEVADRNNNRDSMKMAVRNIITAPNPMRIRELVDRRVIPFGENRPLQIQRHSAECFGWTFQYTPYKPDWGKIKPVSGNKPLTYPKPNIERED